MTNEAMNIIKLHLPRYPEEGGEASLVTKQCILEKLTSQLDNISCWEVTLDLVESVLNSLGLLDISALENGNWKFVSHPAQLCALSLLESITDPKQRFLPEGFWHTAGVSDDVKQRQKSVLKALEDRRRDCRLDESLPKPIRYIYVAWAIVKIDGKFLFHRREAKEHANEFTLVGGRTNLKDLKLVIGQDASISHLLQDLQSPGSESMLNVMDRTIIRELEEETHLCHPDHYRASHYCDLKTYSQCMGAAPNYAYTQYFFRLYHIDLSTTGFLRLRQAVNDSQGDLIECSVSEILAGKTIDGGKKFTFDAVYRHFDDHRNELEKFFETAPSSYANRYLFSGDDTGIILSRDEPLAMGISGKEKEVALSLSPDSKAWIMGLGGYAKGFPSKSSHYIIQHYYGWIEVTDEMIQKRLSEIAEELRRLDLPLIEVTDSHYFRLSVDPGALFFDPRLFTFSVMESLPSKNKRALRITREEIETPLGRFMPENRTILVNRHLADELKQVVTGDAPCADEGQLTRRVRSAAQDLYQALGLRRLLNTSNKDYVIACHTR